MISGSLAVDGNANLFLLNPNGITFGHDATLSLNGGSFVATTANAIQFGNRGSFSATNPQSPELLTVRPSAFLFNQMPHGEIVDRAALPMGEGQFFDTFVGLRVPDGNSLLLVGGAVRLDAGGLNALEGRVEVGGVVGAATVGLRDDDGLRLAFAPNTQRADVSLSNQSAINVTGGDLVIEANSLRLNNVSSLSANAVSTVAPSGNISIHAQDQIVLTDYNLITSEGAISSKNSGQITLQARSIRLLNNSIISAEAFGTGDAGQIQLFTPSLELSSSSITTSTVAGGNAGNIVIRGADSVRLNDSLIRAQAQNVVVNGGNGGNLEIEARQILLNQGQFLTTTVATDGGNITLTNAQLLSLDRQSRIDTNAGQENNRGNGGNIRLNAQFIVANPFSNNDISANAYQGNGGQVDIQSDQIFGIEYRLNGSDRTSDITVSSRFGNPGTVRINGLAADPSRGLTALPTNPIDPTTRIARACGAATIASRNSNNSSNNHSSDSPENTANNNLGNAPNQFVITGHGGLPPSPTDAIGAETQVGWAELTASQASERQRTETPRSQPPNSPDPELPDPGLIEAQGWIMNRAGQVVLVANAPIATPTAAAFSSDRCAAR